MDAALNDARTASNWRARSEAEAREILGRDFDIVVSRGAIYCESRAYGWWQANEGDLHGAYLAAARVARTVLPPLGTGPLEPEVSARQLVGPAFARSKAQASTMNGNNRVRFPAGGSNPIATFTGDSLTDTGVIRFQRAVTKSHARFHGDIKRAAGFKS